MPPNACRIVCAARLRFAAIARSLEQRLPGDRAAVERREIELHDRLAAQQRLDVAEPRMIRADQHGHGAGVARIDAMPRVRRDDGGRHTIGSASRDISVTGASGASVTIAPKWRWLEFSRPGPAEITRRSHA